MKKGFTHKRIPTLLALLILFASLTVTTFLVQTQTNLIGLATPDITPQLVKVANVNDNSLSISFITNQKAKTAVVFNEVGKPSQTYFDVRGGNEAYLSHHINISNLSQNTTYQFSIISEGQTFNNNGEPYQIKTAPKLSSTPLSLPEISGKVILPDSTNAHDTMVIVEISGAQLLSGITDANGDYKISPNKLRTENLESFISQKPQQITIKFFRQSLSSEVKTNFENSQNIPTALLSYKYDFSQLTTTNIGTSSSLLKVAQETGADVTIISPKSGQSYIDAQLQMTGTAVANESVRVVLSPDNISATVYANRNGVWSYRPTRPLRVGQHRLTITTVDELGITRSLSANFETYASGTQVSQSATPSATINPPTPTPTVTRAPTPTLTLTPTITPSPTSGPTPQSPTATQIPTIAQATPTIGMGGGISPTLIEKPTSTPLPLPPPAAPGSASSIIIATLSILLVIGGAVIIFML